MIGSCLRLRRLRRARFRRATLRERVVEDAEAGRSPSEICSGQVVRVIRDGAHVPLRDMPKQPLRAGDRILEIIEG